MAVHKKSRQRVEKLQVSQVFSCPVCGRLLDIAHVTEGVKSGLMVVCHTPNCEYKGKWITPKTENDDD